MLIIKRLIDIILALIILIVTSPIILITSILIKINMGSPVFFKQKRPGLNSEIFTIYKFKTMTEKRDEMGVLLPDEKRLTKLGRVLRKLSVDELPQLINVIRGDLSLVGPRPLLVEYLELYSPKQARRHNVKPGITGWAQVNGRNGISWEEKLDLDVWYVDNQSLWLDFKILALTIIKIFKTEDVNAKGHATTKKFEGSNKTTLEGKN
ncbi:sugar transferase [Shouchella clausii]|uniref:sugar transferase n=1 Tax=Shouchella clausii TaxID=79880 RepID=UPI00266C13FA|nr:sugar transferase [Shouchella clausii]MDO7283906.1 sugar transferase [Shouchella clausii]MDO7304002.1 sugar transferase [Shouchella clausii]